MDVNTLTEHYYAYLGSLITIQSAGFAIAKCCLSQLVVICQSVIYQASKQKISMSVEESFKLTKFDVREET